MLKSLLFIAAVVVPLSLQAQTKIEKYMTVQLQRMSVPIATKSQLVATEKCLKVANRFWYIANMGTIKRPLLKGSCRKAEPVSPFVDLG